MFDIDPNTLFYIKTLPKDKIYTLVLKEKPSPFENASIIIEENKTYERFNSR
jgi:hypothetical protein